MEITFYPDPETEILGYVGIIYKTFKNDGLAIDKIRNYNCNNSC